MAFLRKYATGGSCRTTDTRTSMSSYSLFSRARLYTTVPTQQTVKFILRTVCTTFVWRLHGYLLRSLLCYCTTVLLTVSVCSYGKSSKKYNNSIIVVVVVYPRLVCDTLMQSRLGSTIHVSIKHFCFSSYGCVDCRATLLVVATHLTGKTTT